MYPAAVVHARRDDLPFRVRLWLRVFVGGVEEVRATEVFFWLVVNGFIEKRQDFFFHVGHVRGALLPVVAEVFIKFLDIGSNQSVFGTK